MCVHIRPPAAAAPAHRSVSRFLCAHNTALLPHTNNHNNTRHATHYIYIHAYTHADAQKLAKHAIYALHRGDPAAARRQLAEARGVHLELLPLVRRQPALRFGAYAAALEEVTRGRVLLARRGAAGGEGNPVCLGRCFLLRLLSTHDGLVAMPHPTFFPTAVITNRHQTPPTKQYAEGVAFLVFLEEGRLARRADMAHVDVEECEREAESSGHWDDGQGGRQWELCFGRAAC